jgi:hypothetical protein
MMKFPILWLAAQSGIFLPGRYPDLIRQILRANACQRQSIGRTVKLGRSYRQEDNYE